MTESTAPSATSPGGAAAAAVACAIGIGPGASMNLPCCPSSIRGSNAVKLLGATVGVATHTIELSNIVIGDLPFTGNGTFYITVECSANPPMRTSVSEPKPPKVVHFPEVITVRMRESLLENAVKISVSELDVVGSTEVCELRLTPVNMVAWARDPEISVKRFAMTVCDRNRNTVTPPWIALEFQFPINDIRQLESLHNDTWTVRTATWTGQDAVGTYQDKDIVDFKHQYALVDTGGSLVQEPDEGDIRTVSTCRACVRRSTRLTGCCSVLVVMLVFFARAYFSSCYGHFYALTQVLGADGQDGATGKWNESQPISYAYLNAIENNCEEQVGGMQIQDGTHPCRPSFRQVNMTCEHLPAAQKEPLAFRRAAEALLGEAGTPLTCIPHVCTYYIMLEDHEFWLVFGSGTLLLFSLFVVGPLLNHMVDIYRRLRIKEHNSMVHGIRENMRKFHNMAGGGGSDQAPLITNKNRR
eukprot:CAMPEP_0183582108 /NCGR_PEP_ID=MMETSP0371-20130417/149050_1 /TAXON_ID=268820 /ORGANISM="Peridinium aciculiferum, Strain PAER-2" /LENGTH=470 /DNA_ID=CAMNT_0025792831 /DNA_START=78 /DNA_END=1489 /DNA_ORIENTATION=-